MSRASTLFRQISVWLLLLGALPASAATLFDPALHFRTLATDHFVIYFHEGEERGAARLAVIAEETWQTLQGRLVTTPPRRTHVVLVDQGEVSNGWATPLPYDTILIAAAWPGGSDFIGLTDDWLRLVFAHEFTHIVHLDRSRSWARGVRAVFGRNPIAFPNLFLPVWQIEGLATYEESRLTGQGRLHAGDFGAIEREAARTKTMEPLDRINGGLTNWPNGLAPYAYGLGFHQYLADRYGDASIAAMAEKTAGRFPYTASRVFKPIYGRSLGDLWREYQASARMTEVRTVGDNSVTQLTHDGFEVSGPRFLPSACEGCPVEIVYSVRTPHEFPSLNVVQLDRLRSHRLVKRYGGATSGVSSTAIVFDQLELRRNVGLYSDLFVLDRTSGKVRALTSGARLLDPDLAPDQQSVVCVREGSGHRELVLVKIRPSDFGTPDFRLETPDLRLETSEVIVLASDPDAEFNAPRWSPDGRSIAVERHRLGALSEIVVVDLATKATRPVAAIESARVVTPAWRPDGLAIVAAADVGGGPFNLFEFPLDSGAFSQLTSLTGGATWPDVSADGTTIAFVGYTINGFDVFTMPYQSPGASRQSPVDSRRSPVAGRQSPVSSLQSPVSSPQSPVSSLKSRASSTSDLRLETSDLPSHSYLPWPTLRPTSWTPIIESSSEQVRAGFATSGQDVLGYHGWTFWATWLVSGPENATLPSTATPDWQIAYAYDRWRPTLFASASSRTSFFAGPPTSFGSAANGTLRERDLEAGMIMPFRHVRISHRGFASLLRASDEYSLPGGTVSVERAAVRLGWATTSAQTYGYSISPEHGVSAGATLELVRRSLGASADATTATLDARAYLPSLVQHHVVAIRLAGGISNGNATGKRTFLLGGSDPSPDVLDFDGQAFSLLRGFPFATFAGTRIAVVNAEYRWPIARPQRGAGTWPLFVHTIHASAFGDAGNVWTDAFRARDVKTSVGAEVSANLIAGYTFPFTATAGVAWGRQRSETIRRDMTAYLRIGRAF